MSVLIIVFQFTICNMCIDLRRRERLMTQQFLDAVESGTVVEHRRGEGVAERMGRPFALRNGGKRIAHDTVNLSRINRSPFVGQKEYVVLHRLIRFSKRSVAFYQFAKFITERNYSIFITFTMPL